MRLLLHFARYGPYHHARLRAVQAEMAPLGWEVIGLQTASTDATYDWREEPSAGSSKAEEAAILTLFPGRTYEEIPVGECRRTLITALDHLSPDAIAAPGWGTLDARVSLGWCRCRGARAVIMSETREVDGTRRWWKERIKSLIMRHVHGALVGGAAHRDYLVKLGIPASRIVTGYNVVDNAYFAAEAARWRAVGGSSVGNRSDCKEWRWTERSEVNERSAVGGAGAVGGVELPQPYFLASNRFIERKNLVRLIEAYARCVSAYTNQAPGTGNEERSAPWSLVLLGDGQMKPWLVTRCRDLGLNVVESSPWEGSLNKAQSTKNEELSASPTIFFPGFRQIEELPRFYAHAGAFIHPALEEPWGLVINEAMACGLPVLSGNNVGAAQELICEGVNGWTFDTTNVAAMAEAMEKLAGLSDEERLAMGRAGAALLEERCPTQAFASGLRRLLE